MIVELLTDKYPREKYRPRELHDFVINNKCHWGQRKLLLTEIYFIMKYNSIDNIIYIGAAAGYHIMILSKIFKNKIFYLYDSGNFYSKLTKRENIKIFSYYFTEKVASTLNKLGIKYLLISDIRSSNEDKYDKNSKYVFEENVYNDNVFQIKICNILKPVAASLKFRCVFPDIEESIVNNLKNIKYNIDNNDILNETNEINKTNKNNKDYEYKPGKSLFCEGDIVFQNWSGISSTETRVITNKYDKITYYDNKKYEENLCYYNNNIRTKNYDYYFPSLSFIDIKNIDKYKYILKYIYLDIYDSNKEIEMIKYLINNNMINDIIEKNKNKFIGFFGCYGIEKDSLDLMNILIFGNYISNKLSYYTNKKCINLKNYSIKNRYKYFNKFFYKKNTIKKSNSCVNFQIYDIENVKKSTKNMTRYYSDKKIKN